MKNVLLVLALILGNKAILYGQCAISGLSSTYCAKSSSVGISVSPAGGLLSGNGISNSVFSPSLAGIGAHTVNYSYCSSTYSLESRSFIQVPYIPIYVTLGDNQMSTQLPIGFTFRFFCNDYSSFYISSNGFITFSSQQSSGCCQGPILPASSVADNIIACAWTDLDPSQGGTIRYSLIGSSPNRALIVSFNCIFHKTGQGPVTSEIWLYESSNAIEISTVTKPIPTGSIQYNTTMGIQSGNGQAYVIPGRNGTSNWIATNELLRFTPGVDCSFTQTINVYPNPTVVATSSKTYICLGETIILNASGSSNYIWNNVQSGSNVTETPTMNTAYIVIGTDSLGCVGSGTVYVKVSGCSSLEKLSLSENNLFYVYPNPSKGNINIQSYSNVRVELKNELGENVKTLELSENNNYNVSLRNLASGVYILIGYQYGELINKKTIIVGD